ncbi:YdaS family helix-turn-helix protein [Candidatus Symbiopectobacterium sp.]|uniref:transcriptional regulator n=1 Tax=unclassified Symbiopectobacterium TaxID=2794573 RepID=UPI0025C1DDEC|nr:YdaS family helix-turn-helix protein [Candidatus Symbiopectobacterium sp.]
MKEFWDTLTIAEQHKLAHKVGSSRGYLRLIFNGYKKVGFSLARSLEEATDGAVTKAQLRPDIYENLVGAPQKAKYYQYLSA